MEQGLYSVLSGVSPQIAGGRIYPRLPQKPVFPLVRYQRIDTQRVSSVDGENIGPTEFTMQIDCMAETYEAAKTLASQVFGTLHLYSGTWGSSICRGCFIETENDFFEQDGDDVTHWVTQRYSIVTNDN